MQCKLRELCQFDCFNIGSGLPLGKEGPFVHISSIAANQFMKIFSNITDPQEYESRFFEVQ